MGKYLLTDELCSVPGCTEPMFTLKRGLCCKHNARAKRHGDPLAGATFQTKRGKALAFYRDVVLTYEGDECLAWPYRRTQRDGYGAMILNGKNVLVHRQVCIDVYGLPPTPKHESAHRCGKGHLGCVAKRHLRWATPIENAADKFLHGTSGKGEDSPAAKLTDADVLYLRSLPIGYDRRAEAARLDVSVMTISEARTGKCWAHLPNAKPWRFKS